MTYYGLLSQHQQTNKQTKPHANSLLSVSDLNRFLMAFGPVGLMIALTIA